MPQAITLRYDPPLHQPVRYRTVTQVTGDLGTATVRSETSVEAVSRTQDLIRLEVRRISAKVDVPIWSDLAGLADAAYPDPVKFTASPQVDFQPQESAFIGKGGWIQWPMGALQGFQFPNRAVRVRDTWKSMLSGGEVWDRPTPDGEVRLDDLTLSFHLAAVEGPMGTQSALIEFLLWRPVPLFQRKSALETSHGLAQRTEIRQSGRVRLDIQTGVLLGLTLQTYLTIQGKERSLTIEFSQVMVRTNRRENAGSKRSSTLR